MTIQKLLDKVQDEKPNSFGAERLVAFINEIEQDVAEQLRYEAEDIPAYTAEDLTPVLIVPAPYDRLYVSYLKAQIDYANEELDSYANNQAQHAQDYDDFMDWIVRENKAESNPMPVRFRNIF